MGECIQPSRKRPVFIILSLVMFVCSLLCEVYFFVVLNDIFAKKETATDVLTAIFEWMLLLAPTLSLISIFWVLGMILGVVSWVRLETYRSYLQWMLVLEVGNAILFLLIMTFGYQ